MNRVLFAALLLTGSAVALAQTPPAKPAAKPAAPKAAAKKPAPKAAAKPAELTLPEAGVDQNAAATLVNYGHYACEFDQTVHIVATPQHVGYVDVNYGKLKYTMRPVLSSTGAVRLEDVRGKTMMLQIAYKSMLMDVEAGRRLVDECVNEKQAAAKKAAEGQPSTALLMSPEQRQAQAAAAASAAAAAASAASATGATTADAATAPKTQ